MHKIPIFFLLMFLLSWPCRAQDPGVQNFQEIASRLDIGGDLFFVMHAGRWLDGVFARLEGTEDAVPPSSYRERELRETSGRWREFAARQGISGLQGLGISSAPLDGDGFSLKLFLLRDVQEANLPFWRGLFGWQPRRLLSLDFVPADTQFVWAATPDFAGLWQLLESARSELEQASLDQMLSHITEASLRLVEAEPLPLLQTLRDEVLLAVRRVDAEETNGNGVWEWLVVVGTGDQDLFLAVQQYFSGAGKTFEEVMIGGYTMQRLHLPADGVRKGGQVAFAAVPGFFIFGSSSRMLEDALRAQRHRSGLVSRPVFIDAFRGQNMVNNGLLYISRQGAQILQTLHGARIQGAATQAGDPFSQHVVAELVGGGTRDAVFALTLLNWRQGVMIAGRSGISGAAMASWLGSFPARILFQLPERVIHWLGE